MRVNVSAAVSCVVWLSVMSGCNVNLQHDLNEGDANDIYVLLQNNSINADKIKEGEGKDARYVIVVPKADVAAAASLLREHSLPREQADGLAVFKQTKGMIPTQTEERAMFIEALAGEVSNSLLKIPNVLEAKAIVNIPENNDLAQADKRPLPSASVLMKYMPDPGDKPPVTETEVRDFVARAVAELKPENVKVIMTKYVPPPKDENENRMQLVMGVRVDKASASTLKGMIGMGVVVILVLIAAVVFFALRKPPVSNGRRGKAQEA
jgi:type III secretion protein J